MTNPTSRDTPLLTYPEPPAKLRKRLTLGAALAVLGPGLTRDEVPNRIAAALVRPAQDDGWRVCALGRTRAGLLAYVDDVRAVRSAGKLRTCDAAVEAAGPSYQRLIGPACRRFGLVLALPAKHPGALFADQPIASVPEFLVAGAEGRGWMTTESAPLCKQSGTG